MIKSINSNVFFSCRFPSSSMIFGRKLPMLAETGDSQRTLTILEKGGFRPEKYNESYQSFVEKNHRHEGLDIIKTAHEKFPNDPVSCNHCFSQVKYQQEQYNFPKIKRLTLDSTNLYETITL